MATSTLAHSVCTRTGVRTCVVLRYRTGYVRVKYGMSHFLLVVSIVSFSVMFVVFFFFQAEDGIRDIGVTGVQTCALPIWKAVLVDVALDENLSLSIRN